MNDSSPKHGDYGHNCWEGCEVWNRANEGRKRRMKEIVAGVKPTPVEMRVETVTAYVNRGPKLKKCHRVMAEKLRDDFNKPPMELRDRELWLMGFDTAVRVVSRTLEEVNRNHKHPFDRKTFEEIIYGGEK